MRPRYSRWVLPGLFAGLLLFGRGTALAQTQTPTNPVEPRPGTRQDRKEDQAEAQQLHDKIRLDREKLQADEKQFGKNSPQVKADRQRLRADRRALYKLREDRERDRNLSHRRRHHRNLG